jgi:arsenate reductase
VKEVNTMKIYGLKNCDTCRKALKALPSAQLVDVRVDGVPEDVLDRALAQFGAALLNTRSTTWRGLDEGARQGDPKVLILEHPALMKRPLVAVDNALFLSWNNEIESEVKAML